MEYKICFLGSGKHILTRRLAQHLAERGHNVHLVSFEQLDKKIDWENVTPHFVKPSFPNYCSFLFPVREIKNIIKKGSFDILHGFQATNYGLLGARISFSPYVVSTLGSDILYTPFAGYGYKNYILQRVVNYTFKKADIITVETRHAKDFIVSNFQADTRKLKIFSYGVETNIFKSIGHHNPDKLTIISPRAMEKIYNIDVIVRAIPSCIQQYPNLKFTFLAGIGNKKYIKVIENLVSKLNIGNYVRFIEDILSPPGMVDEFSKASILISIPSTDSLSKSVLEGILCGTIPILSDIPANREIKKMGIPVNFVTKNDHKKLADKILWTLQNLDKVREEIRTIRGKIEKKCSTDMCVDKLEDIYRGLLTSGRCV